MIRILLCFVLLFACPAQTQTEEEVENMIAEMNRLKNDPLANALERYRIADYLNALADFLIRNDALLEMGALTPILDLDEEKYCASEEPSAILDAKNKVLALHFVNFNGMTEKTKNRIQELSIRISPNKNPSTTSNRPHLCRG